MSEGKWEFRWDWIDPILKEYIVSDKDRKQRQKTCRSCDRLSKAKICKECGCFMPGKTLLKGSECPLEKWGSIE